MPGVVIVGAQWGDEGKGKIVDLLTEGADVVVRYAGGPNAGHTLVIPDGAGGHVSFRLHLQDWIDHRYRRRNDGRRHYGLLAMKNLIINNSEGHYGLGRCRLDVDRALHVGAYDGGIRWRGAFAMERR